MIIIIEYQWDDYWKIQRYTVINRKSRNRIPVQTRNPACEHCGLWRAIQMRRMRDLKAGSTPSNRSGHMFLVTKTLCRYTVHLGPLVGDSSGHRLFQLPWRGLLGIFVLQVAHCWWEREIVQILWKSVWQFLKRLSIQVTMWPNDSMPRYISKRIEKMSTQKRVHVCS